jgi:hypothetical protein
VVDAVYASTQARPLTAVGFDWYDPIASHAIEVPGRRGPGGRRSWSTGRAIWDVPADAHALGAWCRAESGFHRDLPLWVVENGMATRVVDGVSEPRRDGARRPEYLRQHLGAVADAVAQGVAVRAYLHWSLVDNYEWGTYQPRLGLFGMERSASGAIRWMDTDAAGDDSAGAFARIVAGLTAGDRSVLEG